MILQIPVPHSCVAPRDAVDRPAGRAEWPCAAGCNLGMVDHSGLPAVVELHSIVIRDCTTLRSTVQSPHPSLVPVRRVASPAVAGNLVLGGPRMAAALTRVLPSPEADFFVHAVPCRDQPIIGYTM